MKYEQDLEFYATARQLRWQKLKAQRTKMLKRLQKEKFEYRLQAQKTLKEVNLLAMVTMVTILIPIILILETQFFLAGRRYPGHVPPSPGPQGGRL